MCPKYYSQLISISIVLASNERNMIIAKLSFSCIQSTLNRCLYLVLKNVWLLSTYELDVLIVYYLDLISEEIIDSVSFVQFY